MTTIRVDPSEMARVAQELADASGKLRAKAEDVASEAAGAPEHDGQFGPQVREMAFEAQNPLLAQAVRLDELSDELATLSQAFAEADAQSREGLTGLMLSLSKLFAKLGLAPASPEYLSATDRVFTQLTPTPKPQVAHGSAIAAQTLSSGSSKLTSGMPTEPIYAGGMSEAELASLQQFQGPRNDCAEYSVAAGLNVIYAGRVRGRDVATLADLGSFGYYRTFPNGPTSPAQAARIVNDIAGRGGLALTASSGKSTPEELVDHLDDQGKALVVTIGWSDDEVPQLAQSSDRSTRARGGGWLGHSAHAMLLVAHDPTHLDSSGGPAPWGFVNSWEDGGSEIFWMPDDDFRRAFDYNIPFAGSNNVVIIEQIAEDGIQTLEPRADSTPTSEATPTSKPEPPEQPEATATPTPPGSDDPQP